MACYGNNIPLEGINEKSDYTTNLNLTKLEFKSEMTSSNSVKYEMVTKNDVTLGGVIRFSDDGVMVNNSLNFSTMGGTDLMKVELYKGGLNTYTNLQNQVEAVMHFKNDKDEEILICIPIKTSTANSEFFNNVKEKSTLDFKHLIPEDSTFILYEGNFPLFGCGKKKKIVFMVGVQDRGITTTLLDNLFKDRESFHDNTVEELRQFSGNTDIKSLYKVNSGDMFINREGISSIDTDDSMGELVCTPYGYVEDDDNGGRKKLSWIKNTADGMSSDTKNFIYIVIFLALIVSVLLVVHNFIFKNISTIMGDDAILVRGDNT